MDRASVDAVQVKVLAWTAAEPKAMEMATPRASKCFFMGWVP